MEILLFLIAFTLHNLEEAFFLPAWSRTSKFQKTVEPKVFRFAVTVITLVAYSIGALYFLWPSNVYLQYLQAGLIGAMLLNVLVPHVAATIAEKKYAPGVVTGLILIFPFGSLAMYHMFQISEIKILGVVFSAIGIGILLLGIIVTLFAIGKRFYKDKLRPR
ncbi:HXXEE domain-containing protein [Terribacillus saccharophilus]|uniref:HXXEE domain-containing protein n=1 Tax=Terribacillus saccharophilus TaxID=361277 RepID=UPI003981F781